MSSSVHTKIHTYMVFAIIANTIDDGYIVHVWRTRTTNLRKVLSNYRQRKGITAPFFADGAAAEIYLLQTLEANLATVYRHCVAWSRHFSENGFELITYPTTYEAAYDLQPETEVIYQRIAQISIPKLLEQPYRHTRTVTPLMAEKTEKELLSARLSIRLTPAEYEHFQGLARQHNLTYREILVVLLSQSGTDIQTTATLIQSQKERIERQQKEITKARNPRGIQADERLKQALAFCQSGVQSYIKRLCSQPQEKPVCSSWNQTVHTFPNRKLYQYPREDGFFSFQLERMCYGKGANAAIFLYGLDLDRNERVMLRYYPKKEYCGVKPPHNGFFTEGTHFLVGAKNNNSGAVDLMAAFPLSWAEEEPEEHSLDAILSSARHRSAMQNHR